MSQPPVASRGAAAAAAPPTIHVRELTNSFRTRRGDVHALAGVSLEVAAGEILVLLDPSGCGKTTLLRCISGPEQPTSGEILWVTARCTPRPTASRSPRRSAV